MKGRKAGTPWPNKPNKFTQYGLEGFPLVESASGEAVPTAADQATRAQASVHEEQELDRFRGCLVGLAVGDAVGTTVEFKARGSFPKMTDMVGGGPFDLKPGQWTDDTSMALCLATGLLNQQGFDARDQMERYCQWRDMGHLSSTGKCFDIGGTTNAALDRYRRTGEAFAGLTDPSAAGNGSIMRLAPVPLFFFPDQAEVERFSAESSRTTHAAEECVDACRLLGVMTATALAGTTKEALLSVGKDMKFVPKIASVATGAYRAKREDDIRGSGYVVDSLEAALWCFASTESFEAAILKAVNLGDDADTTAAVCGQLAGAYYGESRIPQHWREQLAMREDIRSLAERLHAAHPREP